MKSENLISAEVLNDTVLVFSHGVQQGTGYGLGTVVVGFSVESTHKGIDFLEVVVAPDRKIRSFRLSKEPRKIPTWPAD